VLSGIELIDARMNRDIEFVAVFEVSSPDVATIEKGLRFVPGRLPGVFGSKGFLATHGQCQTQRSRPCLASISDARLIRRQGDRSVQGD